ncbi:hypothetical protein Rs2_49328 [Raphanus sativus]|uniref:Uncharacterized protein LOC108821884 n=1 Tax=Raphanus sativus TaxID=3726 RepID=A0A6J0KTG1_RAPSA|nr:uncharacterized protein LOC108821884 [Raphanus sativus]XP_018450375.1 PREDICTED: uncharacterized protein LOC108821884 [Raphanus sativus]XP_018450376.1 PREDICTED: uncharacterized protein LOC108821884 [Raphanus sativus]XP_056855200.1 uncharacterized protein LOC108821884 [Raphanus sativus]KAJ4869128.1 hypothetical protein Rs2_49328 [Raphanus sativus]
MAERKLNLEAPLLSTRRMQKTSAVSVRRNKTFDFSHDFKTNDDSSSVPVLVPDMGLDHFTESASVPFTWEQAPGKLKGNDSTPQEEVFTPCPPPGKAIDRNLSSKTKQVDEEEEESEDVFSDARDTLSPKDSFSVNHSISGVSEYGATAEKKKTLNPCEDPQSRDFMLNRFLPAAKAMTMEQPHYALNRKPSSFMSEPTLQIRDLVPVEKRQNSKRYDECRVSPCYDHQDTDDKESEEEEDGEVSEYAYIPRRGCGMLPQLCFKESLSMMNTFKTKHKTTSHDGVKSSKVSQLRSRFQSVKQLAIDSVSKHKLSPVHPSMGKKFNSETNLTCPASSRSSSPYRHPRCMSPFRTTNATCFPDTRKETESLRANRLNKHIRSMSMSQELLYPNGSTENSPKSTSDHHSSIFPEESEKEPNTSSCRSPLAPPSPKKPSESWLWHNLPSQIPSRRYPFHPQKQDLNDNNNYRNVTKWETIVKTSYLHRDHIRYSEELVAHTSLQ